MNWELTKKNKDEWLIHEGKTAIARVYATMETEKTFDANAKLLYAAPILLKHIYAVIRYLLGEPKTLRRDNLITQLSHSMSMIDLNCPHICDVEGMLKALQKSVENKINRPITRAKIYSGGKKGV